MTIKPVCSAPEKLCLVRLSAIGDVTHTLPIINTIRSHWPQTEITWIIGKAEHQLVSHIPKINFVPFDKKRGVNAYFDLYRRLRKQQFDILLLMQLSLRANLIPLCVKAPIRIGFDKQRAKNIHQFMINQQIIARTKQHVLDSFFGFTEALGIADKQLIWDRCYTEQEMEKIEQCLPGEQKTLLIHACSSRSNRNWPVSRYAAIADYAVERNMRVILSGGPAAKEQRYNQAIQTAARYPLSNYVGKTNLRELAALIQKADILISPDTGAAHIAACSRTPVISLYANSNPERTGPYLSRQWCVNRYPDAAKKFLHKDYQTLPWGKRINAPSVMELITVDEVKEKLAELLR